jgi:hypothetical protein
MSEDMSKTGSTEDYHLSKATIVHITIAESLKGNFAVTSANPILPRTQITVGPTPYESFFEIHFLSIHLEMSSAPAVAVVGYSGYIGKQVMPYAFDALKEKRIKELRILSRKFDPDALKPLVAKGATTQNASYNSVPSLTQALSGIDVVISTVFESELMRYDGFAGGRLETEQGRPSRGNGWSRRQSIHPVGIWNEPLYLELQR